MKVTVEVSDLLKEDEVIIKCKNDDDTIQNLKNYIINFKKTKLTFFKSSSEYFLNLDDIIFFETFDSNISAHTIDDIYTLKARLYELEEKLPFQFLRISKSTIVNIHHIHSIDRNITSASTIKFYNSHKVVYVSRRYFSKLKDKLKERNVL